MTKSDSKAEVEASLSTMLTQIPDGTLSVSAEFGSLSCSSENFDQFSMMRREFEMTVGSMCIPFSNSQTCVEMIFSLDGQSAFKNRLNPLLLSPVSHCLNLSSDYECQDLLNEHSRQHDVIFRLKKSFYVDMIASHLASSDDRLPTMILQQKEFNTINRHIPADPGILGILKNIMDCPYKGDLRSVFIREHLRALFTLQIFHFSPIVTGKTFRLDNRISKRDEEILQEVKLYLDEHFLDPTSLDSVSKHFGINAFKLKHGFKLLFDTSPMRYLQYKRLQYSLFLLRETDRTIKSIADEIGYTHAANFTSAFSKTFGNSPQHYRN